MGGAHSVLAASLLLVARSTHAQSTADADPRRALIAGAQAAADAGDHARALDLASRAASLGMSTSLRLFITQEQEAFGRWVDAYANANACLDDAAADTSLTNREAIVAGCRELLEAARTRVAWLTVHVDAPADALASVRINGQSATLEALGRAYPCEPGPTIIEASANGRVTVRRDVILHPGEMVALTLVPERVAPRAGTTSLHAIAPSLRSRREHSIGPYLVAGGGAAILVGAGVFFGLRQMAQGSCTLDGRALVCATAEDAARAQTAITYNTIADVALAAGIAGVAAGTVWWIVDHRRAERSPTRAAIVPFAGGAMATLEGRL